MCALSSSLTGLQHLAVNKGSWLGHQWPKWVLEQISHSNFAMYKTRDVFHLSGCVAICLQPRTPTQGKHRRKSGSHFQTIPLHGKLKPEWNETIVLWGHTLLASFPGSHTPERKH